MTLRRSAYKAKTWIRKQTRNGSQLWFEASRAERGIAGQLTGQKYAKRIGTTDQYLLTLKGLNWSRGKRSSWMLPPDLFNLPREWLRIIGIVN